MMIKVFAWCAPLVFLGACSSGSADQPISTACDQPAIEATIDMFLHESEMHITTFESLKCSGDWAYAKAAVEDAQGAATNESYLFQRTGLNWVLKAPETACGSVANNGEKPQDTQVPDELWALACTSV
jgi:hypothetical protein